jgi:uncharacterized protein (TIGR04255 family)
VSHGNLPKYTKPPVVEVAVSVTFRPLSNFRSVHFGRFGSINPEYPNSEDQFPLVHTLTFTPGPLPPLRRVLLITENNNFVIQLQADFFAHNWRKMRPDDQYPSFEEIRRHFLTKWDLFREFAERERLGPIAVLSYDVVYINHLFDDTIEPFAVGLGKYLSQIGVQNRGSGRFLPMPTAIQSELTYPILNERGTLRLSLRHGPRTSDGKNVMQMDVAARVKAQEDGTDMIEALEIAHLWIVNGFTDATTEIAHSIWERTQ